MVTNGGYGGMVKNMIAKKYKIGTGIGHSKSPLVSFDKALLNAGVGKYNLVRLSSILPAHCVRVEDVDLEEGSLLPVAYSTISSDTVGDRLVSTIGVGLPVDSDKVGVIMEYSTKNVSTDDALNTLKRMIEEAFKTRGWKLKEMITAHSVSNVTESETVTTFACIAEW